jgi:hypothetical protein
MPSANLLTEISTAKTLTPEVEDKIEKLMTFLPWGDDQVKRGTEVRASITNSMKVIVKNVPPGQTRTRALNHMIDARMLCNAAITFGGQC